MHEQAKIFGPFTFSQVLYIASGVGLSTVLLCNTFYKNRDHFDSTDYFDDYCKSKSHQTQENW